MKSTTILLLMAVFCSVQTVNAQRYFNVGFQYNNHSAKTLDEYTILVGNEAVMNSTPIHYGYGVDLGYLVKNESVESVIGISFSRAPSTQFSDDKTRELKMKKQLVDIHLGFNKYFTDWFFAGGQFLVSNFTGTLKYENTGNIQVIDTLIDFTPDSFNILRGYSVGLRADGGFFIPFSKETGSGMKLEAFYDLGLTRFNYYDSFDKVYTAYSGDKKTRGNKYGFVFSFLIPFGD